MKITISKLLLLVFLAITLTTSCGLLLLMAAAYMIWS